MQRIRWRKRPSLLPADRRRRPRGRARRPPRPTAAADGAHRSHARRCWAEAHQRGTADRRAQSDDWGRCELLAGIDYERIDVIDLPTWTLGLRIWW
jgi:hypothetical protein